MTKMTIDDGMGLAHNSKDHLQPKRPLGEDDEDDDDDGTKFPASSSFNPKNKNPNRMKLRRP